MVLKVTTLTRKKRMTNHPGLPRAGGVGRGSLLGPGTFSFKKLRVLAKPDKFVNVTYASAQECTQHNDWLTRGAPKSLNELESTFGTLHSSYKVKFLWAP